MKEKACQQMSFTSGLVLKSIISERLVGFTRQKKERKNHAACVLDICCLTRVINGKIIEDEAISNFWRFLVEDFKVEDLAGYKTARNLL